VEMEVTELDPNLINVRLAGRLDTPGVDKVELRFTALLVPSGRNAVVDLSGVSFITSMGIRMFISVARGLMARKAKLALYAPQELVNEVFDNASLRDILPICATADEAVAAVRA
jgi:anti-sigma B factor antagonist